MFYVYEALQRNYILCREGLENLPDTNGLLLPGQDVGVVKVEAVEGSRCAPEVLRAAVRSQVGVVARKLRDLKIIPLVKMDDLFSLTSSHEMPPLIVVLIDNFNLVETFSH